MGEVDLCSSFETNGRRIRPGDTGAGVKLYREQTLIRVCRGKKEVDAKANKGGWWR